jgi:co-chaperonin GroES (HSP10)
MKKLNSSLILVKTDQPAVQDDSGIYIQEEWKSLPPTGTVFAVADDVTFCKEGDRVFFERYSAIPAPHHGEDVKLIRAENIFEVIE